MQQEERRRGCQLQCRLLLIKHCKIRTARVHRLRLFGGYHGSHVGLDAPYRSVHATGGDPMQQEERRRRRGGSL